MKNIILLFGLLLFLISGFQKLQAQEGDNRTGYFIEEIKRAKTMIDQYVSPQKQLYLVDDRAEEFMWRAVSPSEREAWFATTSMTAAEKKTVSDALNGLAASAAKKLPIFKPGDEKFAFGSKEEKDMMKSKVPNLADFTVHKIGLADQNWSIVKNDYGIPLYKNKFGYMWFRNNSKIVDHPYCRVYQINITQTYEGGGTYGESYAGYVSKWLCGCP
jgi:hypothetical protein